MNYSKFKIGDVVQLMSGGPSMTVRDPRVQQYDMTIAVAVDWFDVNGILQRDAFAAEMLRTVPEGELEEK